MPAPKNTPAPNNGSLKIPTDEFLAEFGRMGAAKMARKYGCNERTVLKRRRALEGQLGVVLTPPSRGGHIQQLDRHPALVKVDIQSGHILIGSDSHYLPGHVSTAHTAFLEFCREFTPKIIIKNGDELDFPTISRFAHGWEKRPTVAEEIEYTASMLSEIEKSAPKAKLVWPVGNHDSRLETRIATVAPELAKMKGVHLRDHFNPRWEPCMACKVNDDLMIRHRPVSGGVYAARNNTLRSGISTVHGHLHSLKVWPHSDYRGTRFGIDCGTMADPYGPQFYGYTELGPMDWRSGFVLLTFVKGKLLWPEIVWVSGPGTVQFRGKEWSV